MSEYVIERLGLHGDGIAAGPVYVPLSLPGEVVSGEVDGNRLVSMRVGTPSENRVKPPCRHFKSCGGCQLQHAHDDFVAEWKVDVVRQALVAQGLEAEMRPVLTSPARSRRRATLSVRRTKKGAMAGFHMRASDVICAIEDCHLLDPDLMPAFKVAEALALAGGSRKGELSVTATLSNAGLDIAVSGGKPLDGPLQNVLAQEAERMGLARLAWDGEVVAMRARPEHVFGRGAVLPPPGAFLQATREGEAALLQAVLEAVGPDGKSGVDLFAGCGTFTLPLAERFAMHGIEYDAAMLEAVDLAWRKADGLKPLTAEARDLFRNPVIAQDLAYDFAVIDPPRAGAEAQVAQLKDSGVAVIAYVSCNPVAFARDAAQLTRAGYQLDWVQVVDQFRWSSHIELAARFSAT